VTEETQTSKDNNDGKEQLTPRTFRDGLDEIVESHRESGVNTDEIMNIMWTRIVELDRETERRTPYGGER